MNDDTLILLKLPAVINVDETTKLDKFQASPFKQEIALEQVDHVAGFTTLRVRIREKSRFTVFEIDARTAAHWGKAMVKWSEAHPQEAEKSAG